MTFYLSSSMMLIAVFVMLFVAMLLAMLATSLPIAAKILLSTLLIWHCYLAIRKYALANRPNSWQRICCKNDLWCVVSRQGRIFVGQLNQHTYITRVLLILALTSINGKEQIFILVPLDKLPILQFRRLSMKIRALA